MFPVFYYSYFNYGNEKSYLCVDWFIYCIYWAPTLYLCTVLGPGETSVEKNKTKTGKNKRAYILVVVETDIESI